MCQEREASMGKGEGAGGGVLRAGGSREGRRCETVGGREAGEEVWGDAKECGSFRKWLIVSDDGEDGGIRFLEGTSDNYQSSRRAPRGGPRYS